MPFSRVVAAGTESELTPAPTRAARGQRACLLRKDVDDLADDAEAESVEKDCFVAWIALLEERRFKRKSVNAAPWRRVNPGLIQVKRRGSGRLFGAVQGASAVLAWL